MNLKFAINEIWETRNNKKVLIQDIQHTDYGIKCCYLTPEYKPFDYFWVNQQGFEVSNDVESEVDLLIYIGLRKDYPEYFL